MDDELRDAVAFVDLDIVGGIQVDEDDLKLASIVGVDETGRVDYRQALLNGKAAAGLDKAGVTIGQGDGQASGDQTSLKGLEGTVFVGAEVKTGICFMLTVMLDMESP